MGHWDRDAPLHLVQMLCFVVSFIACHVPSNLGNRQLEQGRICVIGSSLSKKVSFFISQIAAMCYLGNEYLVVLSQFVECQHCVYGSFGLYFSVFKSHNCGLAVFCFGEYKVGCCSSHCKYLSLKHSRIFAEMNGFFGNVIVTVFDKHTCSSLVVIKLGAICVALWQLILKLIGSTSL